MTFWQRALTIFVVAGLSACGGNNAQPTVATVSATLPDGAWQWVRSQGHAGSAEHTLVVSGNTVTIHYPTGLQCMRDVRYRDGLMELVPPPPPTGVPGCPEEMISFTECRISTNDLVLQLRPGEYDFYRRLADRPMGGMGGPGGGPMGGMGGPGGGPMGGMGGPGIPPLGGMGGPGIPPLGGMGGMGPGRMMPPAGGPPAFGRDGGMVPPGIAPRGGPSVW